LSETKLRRALGADRVEMADDELVERVTGAIVGFAGPVGLKEPPLPIYADFGVRGCSDVVTGANRDYYHLKGVSLGRDCTVERYVDVRTAGDGDRCPNCKSGVYSLFRGIEVGHIFYLGTKYSEAMHCSFLNEEGIPTLAVMGCYGIGVTRIISAAIEQHHDERGIKWPVPLAPFEVVLLALQMKKEEVVAASDRLYDELVDKGIEVLYDDRPQRPGVKFNDADLVGFSYQLIVGARGLQEGKVEVKDRMTGERIELELEAAASWLADAVGRQRWGA